MDVFLVNPFFNGQAEIPPLGLAAVAAPLTAMGIGVGILDLDLAPSSPDGLSLLRKRIADGRPRILGVTALTNSFPAAPGRVPDSEGSGSGPLHCPGRHSRDGSP